MPFLIVYTLKVNGQVATGGLRRLGERDYVPVVKSFRGEFTALSTAEPKVLACITPLIEIANKQGDPNRISPRSPLAHVVQDLVESVGNDWPFFLDFHEALPVATIRRILGGIATAQLMFVPVLSPDKPAQTRAIAASVGFSDGVCLRLNFTSRVRRTGESLDQQVEMLLGDTAVERADCDLVLDLGQIPQTLGYSAEDLRNGIEEIRHIRQFRNLILIGTSIPDSLAEVGQDAVGTLSRHELRLWRQLRSTKLSRQPTFGDYIIQPPRRPNGFARAVANIRYTSDDQVLIFRGHAIGKSDYAQYRNLCGLLASRREFRGRGFSWGDDQVASVVQGATPPLWQQEWRAIGSSHHLADAVESVGR